MRHTSQWTVVEKDDSEGRGKGEYYKEEQKNGGEDASINNRKYKSSGRGRWRRMCNKTSDWERKTESGECRGKKRNYRTKLNDEMKWRKFVGCSGQQGLAFFN